MLSRLKCILTYNKVQSKHEDVSEVSIDGILSNRKIIHEAWLKHNSRITETEALLLEWSCMTGEMRNHEDVGLHYDGNKSHEIETSAYFSKEHSTLKYAVLRCPIY